MALAWTPRLLPVELQGTPGDRQTMRIGITYDLQTDPADPRQAEFDPPRVIDALHQALEILGHAVVRLGSATELLANARRLGAIEIVFNIAEGAAGRCREAWVPALLERFGVPYVGSGPTALAVGLDKVMSKRLAVAAGIQTPAWISLEPADPVPAMLPLRFPLIVKPRDEGSGFGIDAGAVVHDRSSLERRVHALAQRWGEAILIEEFVGHGEITVCLIGNDPPVAYPAIQRPLDRATGLSSHLIPDDQLLAWDAPLALSPELDARARAIALQVFYLLGCRDVARVDLRVDQQGAIHFLEINPLPTFDPEGSFGLLAEYLGIAYQALIGRVLDAARARLASDESRWLRSLG